MSAQAVPGEAHVATVGVDGEFSVQPGSLLIRVGHPTSLPHLTKAQIFKSLYLAYRHAILDLGNINILRPKNRLLIHLICAHLPRVNLTRFHGVFAPNSKYRARVTPAKRGKREKYHSVHGADQTPAEKRASMTWAQRLKRVFNIDIETCSKCGGDVRIIASIEDPAVIQKILAHLDSTASSTATALLPDCRASPSLPAGLFD